MFAPGSQCRTTVLTYVSRYSIIRYNVKNAVRGLRAEFYPGIAPGNTCPYIYLSANVFFIRLGTKIHGNDTTWNAFFTCELYVVLHYLEVQFNVSMAVCSGTSAYLR